MKSDSDITLLCHWYP